jgi:type IV secretion system protein VirB1
LISNGASKAANRGTPLVGADNGAYRVAMRSVADAALSAALAPAVASAAGVSRPAPAGFVVDTDPATATLLAQVTSPMPVNSQGAPTGRIPTDPATAAAMAQVGMQIPNSAGPVAGAIATDPATAAAMAQIGISANAAGNAPAATEGANGIFVPVVHGPNDPSPSAAAPASAAPAVPGRDQADLRQGGGDGAFVF